MILDRFDPKKRQSQDYRQHEANDRIAPLANLRAKHSHGHREAADDQNDCVGSAQLDVEVIARRCKRCRILITIERIGQEHSAKEHNLSDEKHPHAERARFALLVHVLEVMLQRAVRGGVFVGCG